MSVHEPDGVGEVLEETLRGMIMIGGHLARRRADRRGEQLRQAARDSVEAAQAELDRQHTLRRQSLRAVDGVAHAAWWDHADAGDIREAWLAAREWQHEDPRAANAVWRMADELRDRYGLDVADVDPAAFGRQHQLPERASLTGGEIRALQAQLGAEQHEAVQRLRAAHNDPDGTAAHDAERLTARVGELQELRDIAARAVSPAADSAAPAQQSTGSEDRDPPAATATAHLDATHEHRDELAARLADAGLQDDEVQAQVLGAVAQPDAPSAAVTSRRAPRASKAPTARRLAPKQQRRR